MGKVSKVRFVLPTWIVPVLEYGDESGLSEEDLKKYNSFIERIESEGLSGHWLWSHGSDEYFAWNNDVDTLGAMVCDSELIIVENA